MLKALDVTGEEVLGWDASAGLRYTCPGCGEVVVFKPGRTVTPHFAHKPPVTCAYAMGESARHMAMKAAVGKLVSGRVEVPLLPTRRADVVVPQLRVVIECQASKLSLEEWERRTSDYNRAGWSVLWLWDGDRFSPRGDVREGVYHVPDEIRQCHQQTYGRVYVMGATGSIGAVHLEKLERSSEWYTADGDPMYSSYWPKSLRTVSRRGVLTPLSLTRLQSPDGYGLVTLGDGVWWKPARRAR